MDAQEMERIRALVAETQRPHMMDGWLELDAALAKTVPTLLDALARSQAIEAAARAVDSAAFVPLTNQKPELVLDVRRKEVSDALWKLHDALEGAGDGKTTER
jgi:hypothetical protein